MKNWIVLMFFILLLAGCGTNNQNQGEDVSEQSNIVTKEGVFVGLADTHTIEVIVDSEPISLDITDESISDVSNLDSGDEVTVKYEKNNKGQLLLKKIQQTH
ncbi:CalY family protein [Bacillus inaquosorum]|uniref:TasA family protein n=1 Tax=Bacillus inaquosorum TaxID=483913 RepID=UPI00227E1CF0|nr:TasA family protein [Bacillus inaquosorum]MCY7907002.1 CalY family protein [Bacillus inaquosorum]MCY7930816.1 CalY family protein [Bacillus inaquosorum]MCY8769888.1 CalY family protein [Bacillus inaquosorum]MCY9052020.1 CalY family protein [Bacillus inaquosorum]